MISLLASACGLLVFVYRLGWRRAESSVRAIASDSSPLVSIVVPARNEEKNLPVLLPSLLALDYPHKEVLVVDDGSSDRTAEVASSFAGVTVLPAGAKPEGWVGKNWACARGAEVAHGEMILFTDADTFHDPESLSTAVYELLSTRSGLLTAPPYHLAPTWWEKCLGLFQLLPLLLTAYRHSPSEKRKYSIGQYLLFTRECYHAIGGHAALSSSLTEDIDLGRAVVVGGHGLVVHPEADLYSVRMFEDFSTFTRGWTRLLRLGMGKSNVMSVVELLLVIQLFVGPNSAPGAVLKMTAIGFLLYRQRHFGEFSWWGALLFPISLTLFTCLSLAAVFERLAGRPVVWRDRAYSSGFENENSERTRSA